jgi:hypothetical protein
MVIGPTPALRRLFSEALLLWMPAALSVSAETNFWGKRP